MKRKKKGKKIKLKVKIDSKDPPFTADNRKSPIFPVRYCCDFLGFSYAFVYLTPFNLFVLAFDQPCCR